LLPIGERKIKYGYNEFARRINIGCLSLVFISVIKYQKKQAHEDVADGKQMK
jgi:hypothetical protein